MSEAGPQSSAALTVGTVVGVLLAVLFSWLFMVMAGVAFLPAGIIPIVLLIGWAIASAALFGRPDDPVDDH